MVFKRHRITRRVIEDLKKRSTIGLFFYLILAYVTVFTSTFYSRHEHFAILFLPGITFICVFRLVQVVVSNRNPKYIMGKYYAVFWGSVVSTSLIWGSAFAYIVILKTEPDIRLLMSICSTGLCAGGVVAFIPDIRLSIVFNFTMLIPALILSLKAEIYEFSLMISLFTGYLCLIAFRGNKEYWDAYENEYLLKIKTKELKKISNTDVLTNLYNRRYFDEIFQKEWKRGSRENCILTLMICDLDYFKKINDTYGHLAGDEYLKKAAEIILNTFKRDVDIVARYGGEEFVVLLPGCDSVRALDLAEEVRETFEKTSVLYNENEIKTTISFGIVSCYPAHNKHRNFMVAKADKALYSAKNEGRNRVKLSAENDINFSPRSSSK